MKTFLRTFIILMAFGFSLKVMAQGTTLTVFSEKGENFTVFVNGDQKNSTEADHVVVERLFGPSFKVRIVFSDASIPEINKTVFNSPGGELFYALRPGKKGEYVLEKTSSDNGQTQGQSKETTSSSQKDNKQSSNKSESSGTKKGAGCDNPMSEPDFQSSTIAISNAPFEPIRLTQAKKLVDAHCLYSRQIAELLHILNSDSSRLGLAKEAYQHCYDPENYDDVKNALRSNKSRDDLDHYINAGK